MSSTVCAQTKPFTWLDLPGGTNYTLAAASDGRLVVRIPAILTADATATGVVPKVRIFDAMYGEGRSDELVRQFSVTFTPSSDHAVSALVVSMAGTAKLPPGAYSLTIQIAPDKEVNNAKPQLLTLLLTRVPAQLLGPSSIRLTRVSGFDFSPPAQGAMTVTLRELSNKAGIAGLKAFDVREAAASGAQATGKIKVAFAPPELAPGGETEATVTTDGEFPLGIAKGKLDIVSPNLANPVSVGYEVWTRRGRWTIVLAAALGAWLGWYVRIRTAKASALAAARIASSRAVQLVNEEHEASADQTYRAELTRLRDALAKASESADPAAITPAVKALEEAVAAARTELQNALAQCATRADALNAVVSPAWALPSRAGHALERLRNAKAEVELRLEKRDANSASKALQKIETELLPALVNEATNDGTSLADYLVELQRMGPPLPETVRAQILSEGESARVQFPVLSTAVPTATVEEAFIALQKLDRQYGRALSLSGQLPSIVDDFIGQQWARLNVNSSESGAALVHLRETSTLHAKAIVTDLLEPTKGLTLLRARAAELWQLWFDGLVALGVTTKKEELRQALNDGKWSDAIDLAVDSLAANGTRMNAGTTATPPPSPPSNPVDRLDIDGSAGLRIVTARSTSVGLPPLMGSLGERAVLYRVMKRSAAVQSAFFALLFIVGVYVFYADTWIGTDQEMLGLFLLGFGIDLTSERVLALLKNPKGG